MKENLEFYNTVLLILLCVFNEQLLVNFEVLKTHLITIVILNLIRNKEEINKFSEVRNKVFVLFWGGAISCLKNLHFWSE
jgi:hypothetical protein